MKRPVTIPCIFSAFLMSACTLTPPQSPLTAEDAAAQKLAIQELEDALLQEGRTVAAEAREAAEAKAIALAEEQAKQAAAELAQREAEAKAEAEEQARRDAQAKAEAEEQARRDAQAKAEAEEQARQEAEEHARLAAEAKAEESKKPRRAPQLLSSRGRRSYTQVAEEEQKEEEASIVPTAEQQAAALKLLSKQEKPNKPKAKHQPAKAPSAEAAKEGYNHDLRSTLRVRRFAPPEEGSEQNDDTGEPIPNSVELKGFRSPVMKGRLPMNIDGKIIKED